MNSSDQPAEKMGPPNESPETRGDADARMQQLVSRKRELTLKLWSCDWAWIRAYEAARALDRFQAEEMLASRGHKLRICNRQNQPNPRRWITAVFGSSSDKRLIRAAGKGDSTQVTQLLSKEAGEAAKVSALHLASRANQKDVVKLLLAAGVKDAQMIEALRFSALMFAAAWGNTEVVRWLLAAGAEMEARNDSGMTALMLAAVVGHTDVVGALIDGGANPEAKCQAGMTPLWRASFNGKTEVVHRLVLAGADPNSLDNHGWSPLFAAAAEGQVGAVKCLLAAGANKEYTKGPYEPTALDMAKHNRHVDVYDVLTGHVN
jgi:ankyrin repeat protein